MNAEKKHLVDFISEIRLPKEYRTEDHETMGDIMDKDIIKRIARELLKDDV
jgi:hypothetical protein